MIEGEVGWPVAKGAHAVSHAGLQACIQVGRHPGRLTEACMHACMLRC